MSLVDAHRVVSLPPTVRPGETAGTRLRAGCGRYGGRNGGIDGPAPAQLSFPTGMAPSPLGLLIVDSGSGHLRVATATQVRTLGFRAQSTFPGLADVVSLESCGLPDHILFTAASGIYSAYVASPDACAAVCLFPASVKPGAVLRKPTALALAPMRAADTIQFTVVDSLLHSVFVGTVTVSAAKLVAPPGNESCTLSAVITKDQLPERTRPAAVTVPPPGTHVLVGLEPIPFMAHLQPAPPIQKRLSRSGSSAGSLALDSGLDVAPTAGKSSNATFSSSTTPPLMLLTPLGRSAPLFIHLDPPSGLDFLLTAVTALASSPDCVYAACDVLDAPGKSHVIQLSLDAVAPPHVAPPPPASPHGAVRRGLHARLNATLLAQSHNTLALLQQLPAPIAGHALPALHISDSLNGAFSRLCRTLAGFAGLPLSASFATVMPAISSLADKDPAALIGARGKLKQAMASIRSALRQDCAGGRTGHAVLDQLWQWTETLDELIALAFRAANAEGQSPRASPACPARILASRPSLSSL
jgi:hypothetical protein